MNIGSVKGNFLVLVLLQGSVLSDRHAMYFKLVVCISDKFCYLWFAF